MANFPSRKQKKKKKKKKIPTFDFMGEVIVFLYFHS